MNDSIIVKLFSTNSIEIKNTCFLTDRFLMKFKLYLKQISTSDSVVGQDSIILCCDDIRDAVECAEKIVVFLTESGANIKIETELNKLIQNNKKIQQESEANAKYLIDIKNGNVDNNKDFINFKSSCDSILKITLKDYQYRSSFLLAVAKSGFDFSVPGSGKTIISYATYGYLRSMNYVDNILIIGPKNAYNAWFEEYITCFGTEPDFENLSDENLKVAKSYFSSSVGNHKEVSFINIDKIRYLEREMCNFLLSSKSMLVIDEGHKVKNPNASSTKTAMNLAKCSDYKIVLTGTPMPNGYEDLFSLTHIINPYKSIIPFNYQQLKKFTIKGIKPADEDTIMKSLYPYYSRVSKKYLISKGDILPAKFSISFSEMDDDQRLIYDFIDGLIANYQNRWELEFEKVLMKAILIRKMQVSSNPKLLRKSLMKSFEEIIGDLMCSDDADEISAEEIEDLKKKVALAEEMINRDLNNSNIGGVINKYINDEKLVNKNILAVELTKKILNNKSKVIIWDTFVDNMDTLKLMLKSLYHIDSGIINGTVTGEERQTIIKEFRNGDLMVLIASPATLAESISLHRCCQNAIYVNRNFNAAQFIQSKDRIHRINMPDGLTANYYYLINKNSVDEGVSERLDLKESRMLRILDADSIQVGSIESQENSTISDEDLLSTYKM